MFFSNLLNKFSHYEKKIKLKERIDRFIQRNEREGENLGPTAGPRGNGAHYLESPAGPPDAIFG